MYNNIKKIRNYHPKSMRYENQYADELLVPFSALLLELNSIQNLTKFKIDEVFKFWRIENFGTIQDINAEYVAKADELASSLIKPVTSYQNDKKENQLVIANDEMLNVTTEYIKQKFIELSVLEQNYSYTDQLSTEFVHKIAKDTEDKIVLFTTMSTIGNVREFLFANAISQGYTEYQWHTQMDSRVRPTHARMNFRWVSLFEPPKETGGYHVGQDYNCRCWASKFR
jgi:hypothetical protein